MPVQSPSPTDPARAWTTESLCPVCLRRVDAWRAVDGDTVFLEKSCPRHGFFRVPIWRGEPSFASWRRPKRPSPPAPDAPGARGCPLDCGPCGRHAQHTCTLLVEVTARCDLGCPVCFAGSGAKGDQGPSLEVLARRLGEARAKAGNCNLQLSGGEPTTRADLPDIVAAARQAGFGFVQLNTNGLRLGREPDYAARLAQAGLSSVFLQFDGSNAANRALRGAELLELKLAAVTHLSGAGIGVVLVPTVARGVNDHELGDIVRLALGLGPMVRGVHFQPAAAFGRHPFAQGACSPTLPEVLHGLVSQSDGLFSHEDFHPPGCEHERCSFSGTFMRTRGGLDRAPGQGRAGADSCEGSCGPVPTAFEGAVKAKAFTARQWAAPDPERPLGPKADDFDRFLAASGARHRFSVSCMAFQDAWNIDLERVRGCCIHVLSDLGGLIPFCLYNVSGAHGATLYRGRC